MKWPDLRHLDGYLPPELEKAYRRQYLKSDVKVAALSMLLLAIMLVSFAYNDYSLFGFSPVFYFLITLRGVYLIYFIILVAYLWKNQDSVRYDWNMFLWLMLSMFLVIAINLTRPPTYSGNIPVDIILILLVYLAMPIRLLFRSVSAFIFTLSDIFIFFVMRHAGSPVSEYASIFSLMMANVIGVYASARLYSLRRSAFKAMVEEKEAREEIKKEADIWQTTFDSIKDLVSIQDKEYRLVRVNKAYSDAFALEPGAQLGSHCFEIVHGSSGPIEGCPHKQVLQTGSAASTEVFEPRLGIYLEVSCSPIMRKDGILEGTVHIAKNITTRKKLEEKLTQMATQDGLTGLPNRALLSDRFEVAMANARRKSEGLAFMILDLDRFKNINDSFGHAIGDMLLMAVAGRLTAQLRKSDTVARMGGDEFAVLLTETTHVEDSVKTAQKILEAFREPFDLAGMELTITTSIGIASYPADGEDMETLFKNADSAMYLAKEEGRNTYKLFNSKTVQ
jgi:diguanylate cyclase (GGDEF)-like protein/PAS domain S-box-containing protein